MSDFMKRVVSMLLTAVMLVSLIPMQVFAAEEDINGEFQAEIQSEGTLAGEKYSELPQMGDENNGEIAVLYEEDLQDFSTPMTSDIYPEVEKVPLMSAQGHPIGDVNASGTVTTYDRLILTRFLANWKNYAAKILDHDAADVNRDGKVNNKDLTRLMKYLAGDNVSIY